MSPEEKSISIDERRSRLERRANAVRSRLLRTMDALDVRRHQVAELRHQAKRLAPRIGAAVLGFVIMTAALTYGAIQLFKSRRQRRLDRRVARVLGSFRAERKPSLIQELLRRAALAAASVLAGEIAKRTARNAFDGRMPGGRLLPASTAGAAIMVR